MSQQNYFIKQALLNDGWANNVHLRINNTGVITRLEKNTQITPNDQHLGTVVPGLVNCHSHSFQRSIAGLTEYQVSAADTFWSWRDTMYQHANALNPDQLEAISAYLYTEMLKQGYTSVAEFHYLHHQPGGQPYSSISQLSESIINAANTSGINLTLLPTLYMTSGFKQDGLLNQQKRFGNSLEDYLRLHEDATRHAKNYPQHQVGCGIHSLRAVPKTALDELVSHLSRSHSTTPIHLHIAEQLKEVEDSKTFLGKRPVSWLLENYKVDQQWCLIHATHINKQETKALAHSGATVGLCPTTEANLGDGLFPLRDFLDLGGHIAIGSDGNTCTSPLEEMRLLEYGQRLISHRRNISSDKHQRHTGMSLFSRCRQGGARSIGQPTGMLQEGCRADLLVLDDSAADLRALPPQFIIDTLIFAPNQLLIKDVMANGKWYVKDFQSINQVPINTRYTDTISKLRS